MKTTRSDKQEGVDVGDSGTLAQGSVSALLRALPTYPGDRFREASLNSWAVYAIHALSKVGVPATKETITVALFRMYPAKWSLVGFPEYPDSERVNRALLQLRPKYRDWAYGDSQLGWTLNERGKKEAERMERLLTRPGAQVVAGRGSKAQRPRTRAIDQDLRDLENSRLYDLYRRGHGGEASRFDLWACFGASGLTPATALEGMRRDRVHQARALARDDLVEFLGWVRERFTRYFQK